ncbi:hypothetical protein RIF29_42254 [Crotalaria pallida]|uniref:Uncharacterized protein n=1 Tax=Crotalaria pallida TaxID=3830 RepID=A0AAN9ECK4_CROPI
MGKPSLLQMVNTNTTTTTTRKAARNPSSQEATIEGHHHQEITPPPSKQEIMAVPIPVGLTPPIKNLDLYDGTTNAQDRIIAFQCYFSFYGCNHVQFHYLLQRS